MLVAVLAIVGGIVLLTLCADLAVLAAERLSEHLGISPVVVGALVVGLGTSLPELVVSGIAAAQRDTIDLAVGNVVGSNVANITLVLGIGAIITTIHGQTSVMRREGLLMLVASAALVAFAVDGTLARWEGIALLVGMAGAAWMVARGPAAAHSASTSGHTLSPSEINKAIFHTITGLIGVLIGAQLMVTGAVDIAEDLGASEAFIGLTVVAIGTSLPELATTIASARRGSVDLVIGNVLGSNLFNSLGVAGVAGVVGTGVIAESNPATLWVMLAVSAFVVLWGAFRASFDRRIGIVLLVGYALVVVSGL